MDGRVRVLLCVLVLHLQVEAVSIPVVPQTDLAVPPIGAQDAIAEEGQPPRDEGITMGAGGFGNTKGGGDYRWPSLHRFNSLHGFLLFRILWLCSVSIRCGPKEQVLILCLEQLRIYPFIVVHVSTLL